MGGGCLQEVVAHGWFDFVILGLSPVELLYISIKHVCLIMKKQVIHAVLRVSLRF